MNYKEGDAVVSTIDIEANSRTIPAGTPFLILTIPQRPSMDIAIWEKYTSIVIVSICGHKVGSAPWHLDKYFTKMDLND